MRQLILGAVGVVLIAGCSGKKPPEPVDAEQARELLCDVLESWKNGDTIAALRDRSPPVIVADEDWLEGARLTRFQLKDPGDLVGTNLRAQVTLHLQDRRGQNLAPRTVEYIVSPNSVVRAD